ncbi:elongation factor G [Mailhella massiliensis]|uniref:Elongation factor G n=1 Tax=Mailhella massiliensis TaxID=1903261 RepID=A0A921DSA3_9BACT|nr:elongation factor G [Mailhella massiliensis]HJD98359.1 elongation factor G [Mailhella massiliensis]
MSIALENQRTYALVGTGGSGKTSLAEMLLFQAGIINRLGAIEEGTTALDYEPEEIKRRGSIQPGFATFDWKGYRHNLVDIPGDSNFSADMEWILAAVDSAVIVVDAVDGVRPQMRRMWKSVKAAGLPAVAVITKMDRERADFDAALNSLTTHLGVRPVVFYIPILEKGEFVGLVDVFASKAYRFLENGDTEEIAIPEELEDEVLLLRDTSVENIASSDEELMNRYLEEGSLTDEDITLGLRKGVLSGEIVAVLPSSAMKNRGGRRLLNQINNLLASPLDRPAVLGSDASERDADPEAPAACLVFRSLNDAFSGQVNMIRVISGTISSDSTLKNMRTGEMERLGSLFYVNGKTQTACKDTLGPGAIVGVTKLKGTRTGDTLCDEKAPFEVELPKLPPQLITFALAPKQKGDEDKVFAAVQKLLDEDVTLKLSRDEETSDILLAGMGQLHIEISVEKARRRSKVEIELKTPRVPYRETVRGKVQVQGRHKKQSGGRGQFGDCWIEMEGAPRGAGYTFEDGIVGGVIPRQYIPAIDKGIQESAARGYLAGCPVVDFKVRVYDGSYHTVDSSEMAFKMAGSIAFKAAMAQLKVVLLEPIVQMTVTIPDEYMGDVIGDLSSRRGKVLGSDSQGGITELKVNVPMSEVLRYAPDLRSMTGGQGVFTMEFDHYEEAPQPVVDKVVAAHQAAKGNE